MPTRMTNDELEKARAKATEVDLFKFEDANDVDNFFHAVLFKDAVGHFREVTTSGFNSKFHGSTSIGERLTPDEVKSWTKF